MLKLSWISQFEIIVFTDILLCFGYIYMYIYIYICEVTLIFEMSTVRGQQHSFSIHGCSWGSVNVFETENVSTWGGLEPPTLGIMPNALTYWVIRARHLLSHVEYWLWWYRYFWSKVKIWNVNCARAIAFIFDTRTGVLGKVSKFLRQKMSRPEGDSKSETSESCRML